MIFLDTASTTKVKPKVKVEVDKYFKDNYANPMAVYEFADEPAEAISKARQTIAYFIQCKPREIYFTSGGSESNNMAIKGYAFQRYKETKAPIQIITTPIEHHSILNCCKELEELGIAQIKYLSVDQEGRVNPEELKELITEEKALVSIGWVNNEIGTIQHIKYLADIAHKKGAVFHTDAVQAYGKILTRVSYVDMMSVSGHKFGSPKGVGFLYKSDDIEIVSLISGGNQEQKLRAGTHNVPYIAGLGVASKLAEINRESNYKHERLYKYTLLDKIHKELNLVKLNGSIGGSAPNIMNLCFAEYNVRGEELLAYLSENKIYVSTGSACATGEPSHVLKEIGLSEHEIDCSIRLSFNENNHIPEIDKVVETIVNGVNLLRR